ncbi:cutinase family protein [Corynebacterium vitaeruminis]|uniref:Envelope lipids regulation factor n=1 Tax=Corynebacterium vitaeruminis DSM 20294 TaxID=1224164 RepID=W5Y4K1_9CORY|nr:cutinase family protein [Corynebacterium vitaeruminis]AHI23790.1 envelope lipids regulation factor [Corynebacterium vitaeruminis DSM 20294]
MKKFLTVIATILVLVLILTGIGRWVSSRSGSSGGSGTEQSAAQSPAQPDWCPSVEVVAAPGTWESKADDDPVNPTANPNSYMLTITRPLQQAYSADQVKVWTLPYTAQFRNINSMAEMTYDDSRTEGTNTLNAELTATHAECPLTDFILTGFSQGAVIAGDVANQIGTGTGVIPAERVRGVALVADGRRQAGVGQNVGNLVAGVGAEIALQPLDLVVQAVVPGATMRGARSSGFGTLNDKVFELCAPDDSICDAPQDVGNAIARAQQLVQPNVAHSLYATNPNVVPGSTASDWIVGWAEGLINS